MSRREEVSSQIPFAINGLDQSDDLSIKPSIIQRLYGGAVDHQSIDTWRAHVGGGTQSTEVFTNNEGDEAFKITDYTGLRFVGASGAHDFKIEVKGDRVVFSSEKNQISKSYVHFDDIVGGLTLDVNPTGNEKATPKAGQFKESAASQTADVPSAAESYPVTPAPEIKGSEWKFPSNEPFSLLQNTNLYFKSDIYQLVSGSYVKISSGLSLYYGKLGGFYSLTGNPGQLYKPGLTTLKIVDGFGTATAEVDFDYDERAREVTATVRGHLGFSVCDFRRVEDFMLFPNTLCIAL